jgi:hypothetical protein
MKKVLALLFAITLCILTFIVILIGFYYFTPNLLNGAIICVMSAGGFTGSYLLYLSYKSHKEPPIIESPYSTVEQRLAWYKLALEVLNGNPNVLQYYPFVCVLLMYNDTKFHNLLVRQLIPSHKLLPELHAWRTTYDMGEIWFRNHEERVIILKTVIKQLS